MKRPTETTAYDQPQRSPVTRPPAASENAPAAARRPRHGRRRYAEAAAPEPPPAPARSTTRPPPAAAQTRAATAAAATTSNHHASPIIAGASGGAGQPRRTRRLACPLNRSLTPLAPRGGRAESENLPPPYICRSQARIRTPKRRSTHNLYDPAIGHESVTGRPDVAETLLPHQPSTPGEMQHPLRMVNPLSLHISSYPSSRWCGDRRGVGASCRRAGRWPIAGMWRVRVWRSRLGRVRLIS